MLQGKKTKISAVLLAIGGVGAIINGNVMEGLMAVANALAVFGLGDKIERKVGS
jgi:hypothetical protein